MNKEKTGILIKEARVRKKYTQSELGDLLGVSNKAVSRWENGESFPDIGVLENLSNILEIKIQDLVVGEVQSNNDTAMNELVRLVKLQAKSRTKEIYNCVIGLICIIYNGVIGFLGLNNGLGYIGFSEIIGDMLPTALFISLAILLCIILYGYMKQRGDFIPKKKTIDSCFCIISIFSFGWIAFIINLCILMAGKSVSMLGIEPSEYGPFLSAQLYIVLAVNLLLLVIEWYRDVKCFHGINIGMFVSCAVVHLSALYGYVLHSMSTFKEVFKIELIGTITILIETVIFIVLAIKVTKKKRI